MQSGKQNNLPPQITVASLKGYYDNLFGWVNDVYDGREYHPLLFATLLRQPEALKTIREIFPQFQDRITIEYNLGDINVATMYVEVEKDEMGNFSRVHMEFTDRRHYCAQYFDEIKGNFDRLGDTDTYCTGMQLTQYANRNAGENAGEPIGNVAFCMKLCGNCLVLNAFIPPEEE